MPIGDYGEQVVEGRDKAIDALSDALAAETSLRQEYESALMRANAEVEQLRAQLAEAEQERGRWKNSAALYYIRIGELEAAHMAEVARLTTWTTERTRQMETQAARIVELEAQLAAAEQRAEAMLSTARELIDDAAWLASELAAYEDDYILRERALTWRGRADAWLAALRGEARP